ncbi:hypothetical protein ABTN15_19845, partial [Acinetobacter baumannii]
QPSFDPVLAQISHALPNPVLVPKMGDPAEHQAFQTRMDKVGARIQWFDPLPAPLFRQWLSHIDLCLDSPGWSGGLTCQVALEAG